MYQVDILTLLSLNKGTSGQTILLTQKPVKPKGSRAIEVLQGDFVEEIEVSYDDPPPPKNQKLKNLKMEYPRICPKVRVNATLL